MKRRLLIGGAAAAAIATAALLLVPSATTALPFPNGQTVTVTTGCYWNGSASKTAALTVARGVGFNIVNSDTGNHAITQKTKYYYKIAAVNAVGTGPKSNEKSATASYASKSLAPATALGISISVPGNHTFKTCSNTMTLTVTVQ